MPCILHAHPAPTVNVKRKEKEMKILDDIRSLILKLISERGQIGPKFMYIDPITVPSRLTSDLFPSFSVSFPLCLSRVDR